MCSSFAVDGDCDSYSRHSVPRTIRMGTLARAFNAVNAVSVSDLRTLARARVPKFAYDYLAGGADDEVSLRRPGFDAYEFHPMTCRGVHEVSTRTTFLGHKNVECIFGAPTAGHALWAPREGETATARACAATSSASRVFALSTLGTRSPREISQHVPELKHKMFQVYVWNDRELMRDVLAHAKAAGFTSIALTTDLTWFGNRERDLRNGFSIPPVHSLQTTLAAAARPRWAYDFLTSPKIEYAMIRELRGGGASPRAIADFATDAFDATFSWKDAEWFRTQWDGPIAMKGILRPDDARRALDTGYDAVWVTSHGARQLDTAVSPIDVLSSIRKAVGEDAQVIYDGGVMRGTDVVKAIALGADAVGVGKAYLYGLAATGDAEGVKKCFDLLTAETHRAMGLLGVSSVRELRDFGLDLVRSRCRHSASSDI